MIDKRLGVLTQDLLHRRLVFGKPYDPQHEDANAVLNLYVRVSDHSIKAYNYTLLLS